MATLQGIALILFTSASVAAQFISMPQLQSPEWRLYTSAEGTFAGDWPCEPMRRNVSADARPLYEYDCITFIDSGLVVYTAMVMEGNATVDDAAVDNVLGSMVLPNKELVERSTLADGIGRELVIRARDLTEYTRVRGIAAGSRIYIAAVSAMDIEAIKSPDAERFFSSFKPLSPK